MFTSGMRRSVEGETDDDEAGAKDLEEEGEEEEEEVQQDLQAHQLFPL